MNQINQENNIEVEFEMFVRKVNSNDKVIANKGKFAFEYGPTVRVNCIIAGPFLTDISKAWDMPAFEANARQNLALQRGGKPDEIVGAALYLASSGAAFTTGATIRVDGGTR